MSDQGTPRQQFVTGQQFDAILGVLLDVRRRRPDMRIRHIIFEEMQLRLELLRSPVAVTIHLNDERDSQSVNWQETLIITEDGDVLVRRSNEK
jgi:hypothetical protein